MNYLYKSKVLEILSKTFLCRVLVSLNFLQNSGKRKRCKHKDELAKYTNVSGSTTTCSNNSNSVAESTAVSDSDQSCASTLTQLTQRSVRFIEVEIFTVRFSNLVVEMSTRVHPSHQTYMGTTRIW